MQCLPQASAFRSLSEPPRLLPLLGRLMCLKGAASSPYLHLPTDLQAAKLQVPIDHQPSTQLLFLFLSTQGFYISVRIDDGV
jgi:hypothetical protein